MENEDRNTNEGMKKIDIIKLLQMKHLETVTMYTELWLEEKQNVPINEVARSR